MPAFVLAFVAQLSAPVLAFPDPALDDVAAYRGYQTRLFRDAAGNTFQVYLDEREGRVVHLWADAENESIGFSVRGPGGAPVGLRWGGTGATMDRAGRTRGVTHDLVAQGDVVDIGWFLLGSMRVERDFQAWGWHRRPFNSPTFVLDELRRLVERLASLDAATQRLHLAQLNARGIPELRQRLVPLVVRSGEGELRVQQPSLDGRDTLRLAIRVDPQSVVLRQQGNAIQLQARRGGTVPFTVRLSTTGGALTPLSREEIFTPEFRRFLGDATRGRAPGGPDPWLERQARGVELLSSREKLMAGLPTYATYFGRDMLVSALMMRPIWNAGMSEFVVASALRKLSPSGQVSHEEALGGQAVREAAAEYVQLVDAMVEARRASRLAHADSLLARALLVLRNHRRVRENYHMIDDELQLPVLTALWLEDSRIDAAHKRAFLMDSADGEPRLQRLLRELALVSTMTGPYAEQPRVANLISFAPRDSGRWASTSWRDSNAGYAGGRYAMDVNAIWAPHAVGAIVRIVRSLGELGFRGEQLTRAARGTPLATWLREPARLTAAATTWQRAREHFLVRLGPAQVRIAVAARVAALPADERRYWEGALPRNGADRDSMVFLALSLDATGQPIGVVNTDPATGLFLDGLVSSAPPDAAGRSAVRRDVATFVRPYPVGLFIDRVGPVVANDAFATAGVWHTFERDPYHGPRVAWGREVNLFLLGVARHLETAGDTLRDPDRQAWARELGDAMRRVASAVAASGFHSELWSYTMGPAGPAPSRYGTGADVQLWSTTDLAVRWALRRASGVSR